MGLRFPEAFTIKQFKGGYRPGASYHELQDTETNDAHDFIYAQDGTLVKRRGSRKILNQRLSDPANATPVGGSGSGPITGYFHFAKLNTSTQTFHVACVPGGVFNMTSATGTAIRSGLNTTSEVFWNFIHIQDFRSAADDIVIGCNGVNPPILWNGSATAVDLSDTTSATGILPARFMAYYQDRLYLANLNDSSDVDANSRVIISGIGADLAPNPHRLQVLAEGGGDFYLAKGNRQENAIQGMKVLHGQLILYTRSTAWKYTPGQDGTVNTGSLIEMEESIGVLAPFSLVDVGNFHIFLSERGFYAFDGVQFQQLSAQLDNWLFANANRAQLPLAKAIFNKEANQYTCYFPGSGQNRNNLGIAYDLSLKLWQPLITGRRVNYVSSYRRLSDGQEKVVWGDYHGYIYEELETTDSEGGAASNSATGFNGTVRSFTTNTITDTTQAFDTANDGLRGQVLRIYRGTAENQESVIASNTSQTITLEDNFNILPDTASLYTIGAIDGRWRSKDFSFGFDDIAKIFRYVRLQLSEEGAVSATIRCIVDFNDITRALETDVRLLEDSFTWDISSWDRARWGREPAIRRRVSVRPTTDQRVIGNFFAVQVDQRRANERVDIKGIEIDVKPIGKRE